VKYLVLFTLLLSLNASALDLSRTDHQLHFGVSATGTFILSHVFYQSGSSKIDSVLYSAIIMLGAGLAKEMTIGNFETGDLLANTAGVGTGAIASMVFEF